MANNLVIYAGGGVIDYKPLMNSGFTTVILNSLHVNSDGSLNMGDTQLVDSHGHTTAAAKQIGEAVSELKNNGGVKTVLVSIGGGGAFPPDPNGINGEHSVSDSDLKNFLGFYWSATGMTGNLSNEIPILNSLATLLTTLGADGIDLDPEPTFYTYGAFASVTVMLTEWAMKCQGLLATWVPYRAQASWKATAQLLDADEGVSPTWINLQPPAWFDGSNLASWATNLGVSISAIVPGFNTGDPSAIQETLAGLVNAGVGITGAYLWNYNEISSGAVAAYAAAMEQGRQGVQPAAQARRSA